MSLFHRHSRVFAASVAVTLLSLVGGRAADGSSPLIELGRLPHSDRAHANFLPNLVEFVKPATAIRSLDGLVVELTVDLPPNHDINREAPGRVAIRSPLVGDALVAESPLDETRVTLPLHWGASIPALDRGDLVIEAAVYFCDESKKAICKIRSVRVFQPVVVDPTRGAERLAVHVTVPEN